jgi:hypothetical protein
MSRFAPLYVLAAVVGCAHSPPPSALTQIGWSGAPPHVGVQLAGADATSERQAQCDASARAAGVVLDGNAPYQAIVTLDGAANRVSLLSPHGVTRTDRRGAVPVGELCAQAAVAAASLMRDESSGRPLDSQSSFANTPVPSSALHDPNARPTGPEPANMISGEQPRGPIE